MAEMECLIREHVSPRARGVDTQVMHSLFAFNLLAACVDAHAKNHSFFLSGSQVRLAPAYDLISAHGIWDEDRVTYKSAAAVRYGKERRYQNITGRSIARTADTLNADRSHFVEMLNTMATELPLAIKQAIAQVPGALITSKVLGMPKRAKSLQQR